jgi:hypothetical protein
MTLKREIPNLLKIEVPYDREIIEDMFLCRYNKIITEGYAFSYRDFDIFSAIMLRRHGIEGIPEAIRKYAIKDGKIIDRVRFEMIALGVEQFEEVNEDDMDFYIKKLYQRAIERKQIVKKEIGRVINNARKITLKNSAYYRELLNIVKEFNDLTLIDWFIPIKLTFEKFVHIYVKHVEETKFGEGQFKKRSFFDYKHTEILSLLKSILRQEEQDIKDHFLLVSVGISANDSSTVKDYHRGFGKFSKLIFDNNEFRLTIDKNGFIQTFYQDK